ncbi:auxin-responsive protein SAUR21 [Carica papaya]|uniref:auxin-responsive protein SAUR21 n=1 Tax=Carica papaya TaxID=3649 RepID=UPI000B8CB163|nr:auxin-responsive protein SAUR21 [Carica papaya]
MLGKKMVSLKKLAKKVKVIGGGGGGGGGEEKSQVNECLLGKFDEVERSSCNTPVGFFAVYVGEERERFVVPTSFLSHPLFKILLEKSCNEFGFQQRNGLVVPCTVPTFQEVVNAVECNAKFDFGDLVEEFV